MTNPNEDDVDIGADEVVTLTQRNKKQEKHKRTMLEDVFIHIDEERLLI
jgi:hypothetical protein